MPFLTFPDPLLKGVDNEITADKMAIIASAPALSDEGFIGSVSRSVGSLTAGQALKVYGTNLLRVIVSFRTQVGEQSAVVSFDMRPETPTGVLRVSALARDEFLFSQVILLDADGDTRSAIREDMTNPSSLDAIFVP